MFTQTRRARLFQAKPCLEALEDRCLLSGNGLQTNLVADLTQIANTAAAVEQALIASANSATSGVTQTANTAATAAGTVLQTNLVSDLPLGDGVLQDPNLVNPWGISESSGSPFWISDNNAGVSTLYNSVAGATPPAVTINPLVVNIPTPNGPTGGTPTGTVFNTGGGAGAFQLPNGKPATFLFDTEDGTLIGWNGGTQAVIAKDNSGNNFTEPDPAKQTGAVYKGLAIANSPTLGPVLYASNFRSGQIEVYDSNFNPVKLAAGAFTDPNLPKGYAPFNVSVQVVNNTPKVYVTYAKQDADKHDDVAGQGNGFVDVFNLDGTPGMPDGKSVRLISRGVLDSPWGLAIAPQGFAGLSAPNGDSVLLVGNFGNGFINAFDASTGQFLGNLKDSDGEPIQIDGLWALQVGNGGAGGAKDTVYFTAGPFGESHGLFGALTTATPGSPEGPAEQQKVTAVLDVFQLAVQQLNKDLSSGASRATIKQDIQTLNADFVQLVRAELAFAADTIADMNPTGHHGSAGRLEVAVDALFADFGGHEHGRH
ncbi:MAG TPA: TIGR03118 family protein [Gemmataceae bacterium]|jgi:uncharacterized protein (TIGR03118 family)